VTRWVEGYGASYIGDVEFHDGMMMPGDELGFYVHSIIHKHYEISVVLPPSPRRLLGVVSVGIAAAI
jgi:hypothetical protein